MTVRCRYIAAVMIAGCAAATTGPSSQEGTSRTTASSTNDYRHSPELNRLMKNEINKPFSKLTFFVFHSDGEYDYSEIARTTAQFHAGVAKVRAYPDPPVESEQGREVFATFLESLERDCNTLGVAIASRDARQMQKQLGKLSRTCNNCHHFFRLDIADSPER
jgi:cytochrome c556